MTITVRVTLPDLTPTAETSRLLRALIPLAAPALLALIDAGGIALPARLLLHTAVNAAQHTVGTKSA
jgi:hypothetical protein